MGRGGGAGLLPLLHCPPRRGFQRGRPQASTSMGKIAPWLLHRPGKAGSKAEHGTVPFIFGSPVNRDPLSPFSNAK